MKVWPICSLLVISLGCSQGPISLGPQLPTLIGQLKQGDERERTKAMRKLEELGPRAAPAVPLLVEALEDEDQDIRDAASDALEAIGKPAVPSLAQALKEDNQWSARHAAQILGTMGKDAAEAVPSLVIATRNEDPLVRIGAISALGDIGPQAVTAVPSLITLLESPSVASCAFQSLAKIGEPGIPDLSKALMDQNHNVRTSAARVLGKIGPAAVPALMELIKARVHFVDVANEAAYQLGKIGPDARDAIPLLVGRFGYQDERTRRIASFAVARIGRDAVSDLLRALQHRNVLVVATACETIGRMQPPPQEALGRLIGLLEHKDRNLRAYAGRAIGEYGPRGERAIPALVVYLRQSKYKNTARRALSKIGKSAVSALVVALTESDHRVRASAAGALGDVGPDASAAIPALMKLLQDESDYVRTFSLTALHDIGPSEDVSCQRALIGVLQNDADRRVRAYAARTIGKVAVDKEGATTALIDALDDPEETVVRGALKALRRMPAQPTRVVSAYTQLLRHQQIGVRMQAADALGELGPQARSAVPALQHAINDKHDKYGHAQKSAAKALRKIDPEAVLRIKET